MKIRITSALQEGILAIELETRVQVHPRFPSDISLTIFTPIFEVTRPAMIPALLALPCDRIINPCLVSLRAVTDTEAECAWDVVI